jgi:hypothetical protein
MQGQSKLVFDRNVTLDDQVAELLTGKTAPLVEPKLKHLIYALNKRRGAAAAIKNDQLAASLKVSERQIKQMVKDLVEVYGLPVGARRQPPYGYFLAVTAEEIKDTCDNYFREAVSLFYRIGKMADEHTMLEYEGQLRLELAKPAAPPKEAA